jgi:adenosylcobinamide-GDP ribazoletransferase
MTFPPLRQIFQDMGLSLVFFTRLPLKEIDFGGRTLAQAIWAAPLAGLAVALIAGVVFTVAEMSGVSPSVGAALALAVAMLATGCLHEDGLSDVADGFGGGRTQAQKLEIMRDSRIGAYGAAALVMSVLIRWSALADLGTAGAAFAGLIAAHVGSRALMPALMHLTPSARTDGLAAGAGTVSRDTALVAAAIGGIALLLWLGLSGALVAAVLLALVFSLFRQLCLTQIGGHTGDTAGALQQAAEIAILVIASVILS